MENNSLKIFLEINRYNYIFFVGKKNENENFKIIYQSEISSEGIENNKIYDLEKTYNKIKKEVYIIEKKLNYVFKEIILILDYFNPTFINLTGYKKLNGSQVSRENITYILNTLKSCVEEVEPKKK
jgi:cell division ATPase FtsA